MAGEIQLNSTSFASESGGTITINNATVGSAVAMSANQACVKTAINASGSAPIYACRAWINFDGTSASIGTGRANGNVSGVTDLGTGEYTVTFATAMPDTNFCAVLGIGRPSVNYFDRQLTEYFNRSTSQITLYTGLGSATFEDQASVSVSIFR